MKHLLFLFPILILSAVTTFGQNVSANAAIPKDSLEIVNTKDSMVFIWGNKKISIVDKDTSNSLPEILLSLGFNFDFLDGVRTNDLYADVNVDIPFILVPDKKKRNKKNFLHNIGFEFGVYQLRTVSSTDTLKEQFRLIDGRLEDGEVVRDYITANSRTQTSTFRENLGVFFQPKVTIYYNYANPNSYSIFNLLGHFEWARSAVKTTINRNFTKIDTTMEAPPTWPIPYELDDQLPLEEESDEFLDYNINSGVGLDFTIARESGIMHFKSILGLNTSRIVRSVDSGRIIQSNSDPMYLIQAEIMERKLLGLKLGVEVEDTLLVKILSLD